MTEWLKRILRNPAGRIVLFAILTMILAGALWVIYANFTNTPKENTLPVEDFRLPERPVEERKQSLEQLPPLEGPERSFEEKKQLLERMQNQSQ